MQPNWLRARRRRRQVDLAGHQRKAHRKTRQLAPGIAKLVSPSPVKQARGSIDPPNAGKPAGALRCLSKAPSAKCAVGCGHFFQFEVSVVQWLFFPVAVLAGTLMVVQSGCNGMLERILDRPVMVGVVSQVVGYGAGYKPGEIVPQSGVYTIRHDPVHADMPHEVTVIKGRRFPTCRHCKGITGCDVFWDDLEGGGHQRHKLRIVAPYHLRAETRQRGRLLGPGEPDVKCRVHQR